MFVVISWTMPLPRIRVVPLHFMRDNKPLGDALITIILVKFQTRATKSTWRIALTIGCHV